MGGEFMERGEILLATKNGAVATRMELGAGNVRLMAEDSVFSGSFEPDAWKAYVEFETCFSMPNIAGPATGIRYSAFHPGVLARSHQSLLHQQCNFHHMLRAHDPEGVEQDRIMGAVVGVHFPAAPTGGWEIPDSADDAVPVRVLGTVFRMAQGAQDMLDQHEGGKVRWSVSIEATARGTENLGIYVPSEKLIVPILEAPDELMEAVEITEDGEIVPGKYKGEQIAIALGGKDGVVEFQGVGYTPKPADRRAVITGVRAEAAAAEEGKRTLKALASGGVVLCAAAVEEADAGMLGELVREKYGTGAKVLDVVREGRVRLSELSFWSKEASGKDPVVRIRLGSGDVILKRASELEKKLSKKY